MKHIKKYFLITIFISVILSGCSKDKVYITVEYFGLRYGSNYYIYFLVNDEKGNALHNKRVDFKIVKGSGKLSKISGLTAGGEIFVEIENPSADAEIKATVFGYKASVTKKVIANQ